MSLNMWLPLNTANGNEILNNGLKDYSFSGINTEIAMPGDTWESICYGDGKFVAVSGPYNTSEHDPSNIAAYSEDGINWKQVTLPFNDYYVCVCYGNGKFVTFPINNSDKVVYSEDGINWNIATSAYNTPNCTIKACYGDGKFVAIYKDYNKAAYSEDGISWHPTTIPESTWWWSVCYGNGRFVATSYQSDIAAYSDDGINWHKSTMPDGVHDWHDMCYANGKFIVIEAHTHIIASSKDGVNWNLFTDKIISGDVYAFMSACYGDGKVIICTEIGSGAYTEDLTNWKQTTMPVGYYRDVCYGNGKFVAVSQDPYGIKPTYSYDGINWYNSCIPFMNTNNIIGKMAASDTISVASNTESIINDLSNKATLSFRLFYDNKSSGNISGSDSTILLSTSQDGSLYVKLNSATPLYFALPTKLTNNDWNTVTITIDNSSKALEVYLNGKREVVKSFDSFTPIIDESHPFKITYSIAPSYLVDYRLYDEILTPDEIKELAMFVIAHYPLDEVNDTLIHDLYFGEYKKGNLSIVNHRDNIIKSYEYDFTNYSINGSNIRPSSNTLLSTEPIIDYSAEGKVLLSKIMVRVNKYNSGSLSLRSSRFRNDKVSSKVIVDHNSDIGSWKEFNLYNTDIAGYELNDVGLVGTTVNGKFKVYNPVIELAANELSVDEVELPDKYDIRCSLYDEDTDTIYAPICGTDKLLYSLDKGKNWNIDKLPYSADWGYIIKNNGIIVIGDCIRTTKTPFIYSIDGVNWNVVEFENEYVLKGFTTVNDKIVAIYESGYQYLSKDDNNTVTVSNYFNHQFGSNYIVYDNLIIPKAGGTGYKINNVLEDSLDIEEIELPQYTGTNHTISNIKVIDGTKYLITVNNADFVLYGELDNLVEKHIPLSGVWKGIECINNTIVLIEEKNRVVYATLNDIDNFYIHNVKVNDAVNTTDIVINNDIYVFALDSLKYSKIRVHGYNIDMDVDIKCIQYIEDIDDKTGLPYVKDSCEATSINKWKFIEANINTDEDWRLNQVCYGNGKFVAFCGIDGSVVYSYDGTNWNRSQISVTTSGNGCICYGNDMFVAVDKNNSGIIAAYSYDGISWSHTVISNDGDSNIGSICYGNGKFICTLCSGTIMYSVDGINWTKSKLPIDGHYKGICYGNGKFIAATINHNYSGSSENIIYSEDGINWSIGATLNLPANIENVCYGNGKYLAIVKSDSANYIWSEDGIKWTQATLPSGFANPADACYGNGKFVIINTNCDLIYSVDCINWSNKAISNLTINNPRICYGNGKFVIVSSLGSKPACIVNDKYINSQILKKVSSNNTGSNKYKLIKAAADMEVIQTGTNSYTIKGKNILGTDKIGGNGDTAEFTDIFKYNNKLYAVDTLDQSLWSVSAFKIGKDPFVADDRTISHIVSSGGFINLPTTGGTIYYGDNMYYYTIIDSANNVIHLYRSTDCKHWLQGNDLNLATMTGYSRLTRVCYGNGKLVALVIYLNDTDNKYMRYKSYYSTDGISWDSGSENDSDITTKGSTTYVDKMIYSDKFILYATCGDYHFISNDGITWNATEVTPSPYRHAKDVCYCNNHYFIIVNYMTSKLYMSTDCINLTEVFTLNNTFGHDVAYGNGIYVVGLESVKQYYYSTDGTNWNSDNCPIELYRICFGKDKFVAVPHSTKSAVAAYSTDGRNWNVTQLPFTISYADATWTDLLYGDGKFVASTSNITVYSTDGVNWTEVVSVPPENTMPLTDTHIATTVDRYNNLLIVSPNNALICKNGDDIVTGMTEIPTSILPEDKLGDYISAIRNNTSVFVSRVATESPYSGVYIKTDSEGTVQKAVSIVLPVEPPYVDIVVRNDCFIVVPCEGDKLCVSKDGSAWDTIDLPVSARWTLAFNDGNNTLYLATTISSEKSIIYHTNDLEHWGMYIVPKGDICNAAQCNKHLGPNNDYVTFYSNESNDAYITSSNVYTGTGDYKPVNVSEYNTLSSCDVLCHLGEASPVRKRSSLIPHGSSISMNGSGARNDKFSVSVWIKLNNINWDKDFKYSEMIFITIYNLRISFYEGFLRSFNGISNKITDIHYNSISGKWNLFTIIIDNTGERYTLYVNDEVVLSGELLYTIKGDKDIVISNTGLMLKVTDVEASDCKVYNKALTKEEVEFIYNNTVDNYTVAIYDNGILYTNTVNETSNIIADNIIPNNSDFALINTKGSKSVINNSIYHRSVKYTLDAATNGKLVLDLSKIVDKLVVGKKYILSMKIAKTASIKGNIQVNISDKDINIDNVTDNEVEVNIPFKVTSVNTPNIVIEMSNISANAIVKISELLLYPVISDSLAIRNDGICANQIYETSSVNEVSLGDDMLKCRKIITR